MFSNFVNISYYKNINTVIFVSGLKNSQKMLLIDLNNNFI